MCLAAMSAFAETLVDGRLRGHDESGSETLIDDFQPWQRFAVSPPLARTVLPFAGTELITSSANPNANTSQNFTMVAIFIGSSVVV
jgi:hypothetical protein